MSEEVMEYQVDGASKLSPVAVTDGDAVDHPKHYNLLPATCDKCGDGIECIEVVRHMGFNIGNVIKYCWRTGLKDNTTDIEDLKKARWYLDDEIKRREGMSGGS